MSICEACKAGRHMRSVECLVCGGTGYIDDGACHDPECCSPGQCAACQGIGELAACRGGMWCDCQHRTDRQPAVLLGVASPACICDAARGVMAVPPPAGCPVHGDEVRWLRAVQTDG